MTYQFWLSKWGSFSKYIVKSLGFQIFEKLCKRRNLKFLLEHFSEVFGGLYNNSKWYFWMCYWCSIFFENWPRKEYQPFLGKLYYRQLQTSLWHPLQELCGQEIKMAHELQGHSRRNYTRLDLNNEGSQKGVSLIMNNIPSGEYIARRLAEGMPSRKSFNAINGTILFVLVKGSEVENRRIPFFAPVANIPV